MKSIWSYLFPRRRPVTKPARPARRRQSQACNFLEALENRTMLSSYTVSSYFPLPSSAVWNLTGTANSQAGTATVTNAGSVTVDGTATTNYQTVVTTGGTTTTQNDYYTVGANGLQLYRMDYTSAGETYGVVFPAPLTIMPGTVSDSQSLTLSGYGSGTGTFSGTPATWVDSVNGTVSLNSGTQTITIGNTSVQAIEVTEVATFTDTSATSTFTRTVTVDNNYWYALNLGLVKYAISSSETIDGATTPTTYSAAFTLASSPLLTSQVALSGNSTSIAAGETAPSLTNYTDFGNWGAGSGTLSRVYTITNNGSTPLDLIGSPIVTITGADASDFFLTAQPSPTSLPAGVTSAFTINFDPPAKDTGERTATITVSSTDPVTPSFTFEVQGDALAVKNVAKETGLQYAVTTPGTGAGAKAGDNLSVNYSGYLTTGLEFDSSLNANRYPFDFTLGEGQVIVGWDDALVGAKVGENITLIIPSNLGYGTAGSGSIPANAELIFNISVLAFQPSAVVIASADDNIIPSATNTPDTADGTYMGAINLGQSSTSTFDINEIGKLTPRFTGTPNITVIASSNTSDLGSTDFTVTQPVTVSSQITFTVTFTPTTLGFRYAVIRIPYTDSADGYSVTHVYTINVEGMGSTDLFDPTYYLSEYPAAAAAVAAGTYTSAWDQYWEVGQYEGLQPDPYFDPALYLQLNPDVAAEVGTGKAYPSGFAQFVEQGQNQIGYFTYTPGTNAEQFNLGTAPAGTAQVYRPFSYLFDDTFYLAQNPDVANAVAPASTSATATINVATDIKANEFTSGFEHFMIYGVSENREFSPLFDETLYLDENPDVAAAVKAGVWQSGFQQYETDGINEGRAIYPLYSESYYLAQNPTVAAEVTAGTYTSGLQELLYVDGGDLLSQNFSPYYDEAYYLAQYPDVAAAVNAGQFTSGFEHYVLYGQFENRVAVPPAS